MDQKQLNITALNSNEEGLLVGYASVFNIVDQHNDLIKLGAFKKLDKKNIKFLWYHKAEEPIGIIEEIYEDNYGLYFKAKLLLDLPQATSVYKLVKAKAISGVSIGFKAINYYYEGKTRIIEDIELWEISLVTFPANKEANILEVKNQQNKGEYMKQQTWEDFKSINDEINKSIEEKGGADPLLKQQLLKINNYLDEQKSRLDLIETSISRPFAGASVNEGYQNNEHKLAFKNYLRSGNEQSLSRIEKKSLSGASNQDGGYLITSETSKQISKILDEISPMRRIASNEKISSNSLDIIEDYDKAQSGWTAETSPREDTNSPKINKRNIPVFEIYAQPAATQKLIDDAFIDVEKWLAEKLISSFAQLENHAFIHGDGTSCPRGILTYENSKDWGGIEQINSSVENKLDADSLFYLYFSLKEQYCQNASFLMNRATIHAIRTLKDPTTGRYLWNPGLANEMTDSLLGLPVYEATDMPTIGKDKLAIALGDFKSAYKVVDRSGIRVLRDPYTYKPFVKFYTTKRVGGDVINFEAIKLLKISS